MIRLPVRIVCLAVLTLFAALATVACFGAGTAHAMTVTSAMPKGEVRDLTQITVRFSEAMRPLGVMDGKRDAAPLRLTVDHGKLPAGNFRWLDPSTLAYIFDAPVARPVVIRALVPEGTASLTGAVLDKDEAWVVSTPPLALTRGNAPQSELPRQNAAVYLRANYPLDMASLRAKSKLSVNGKARSFTLAEPVPDAYHQGRPSAWRYTYTLKGTLAKNSTVTLDIAPGVTAEEGGKPAGRVSFSLRSYGDLRLKDWRIGGYEPAKQEGSPRPESQLQLTFSNRVRLADLFRHIAVKPDVPLRDRKEILASKAVGASFVLPYLWEPRTRYTVTIKAGLKDEYGSTLAGDKHLTFTTGDYRAFLQMPTGQVVMETGLADRFPLFMRNMGTVTAALRYLPWGKDAFHAMGGNTRVNGSVFRALSGARETNVVMETDKKPNQTVYETLDVPAALGLSAPPDGLMGVTLEPPAGGANEDIARLYANGRFRAELQVTDLGIAAQMGEKQGLVWVASITGGKPVSGAAVQLLDKDGRALWSGTTDAGGMALCPGFPSFPAMPRFVMAKTGGDSSVLSLAAGNLPSSRGEYRKRARDRARWSVHAVSQLPLYQPGQTVNAVVYARRFADKLDAKTLDFADWLPLAGEPLDIRIEDRNGKVVFAFEAKTNAYGSVPFSFTLGRDAEPGWYTVRAKDRAFPYEAMHTPFRVASFRPPEFKVDVTPPPPGPTAKAERLKLTVDAKYFSGALLPGAGVTVEAEYTDSRFSPPRLAGYATGPDFSPFGRFFPRPIRTDSVTVSGKLDANGTAALFLPPPGESLSPRQLFLAATVTDASNLTSQGTASSLLHPSAYYIGLRSPFIVNRGKEATVMLKAATWDDKPLAGLPVTLKAERIVWENGKEIIEPAWEKACILEDETGERVAVRFDKSGAYRLTASIVDKENRKNVAVGRVYVPGPGMGWASARHGGRGEQRLDFLVEDAVYAPGETARIVIKDPFDKAAALVSIERDGVRRATVVEISGEDPVIDIPLGKDDAPYVYAEILLVTGRTAPPPSPETLLQTAGKNARLPDDEGAPFLRRGTVLLKVSGTEPGLSVAVTTDAEEYRPGGTVRATATVTQAGKGGRAQVTLLAVDERVLRAGGEFTAYDPLATFQPLYPNAVYTADIWRLLLKYDQMVIGPDMLRMAAKPAAQAAVPMAEFAASGAENGPGRETLLRQNFSPLAFWLAEGETDGNGELSVSFTLPDTLTSYRIVAVAADAERGFATAQTSVQARQPLQLLPALPKFVVEGDRLDAGILVQNTGNARGTATVTLAVTGAAFAGHGAPSRNITLEAGRSGLLVFPLEVPMLTAARGEIRLRATGRMGEESDAAAFTLPVMPARPLTYVAAAGLLREGERHTLPVKTPGNLDARSRLEVTFAPSPAAGIPIAAGQVIDYPWNCLEQRLSRTWARMIRLEHGALIGLTPDPKDKEAIAREFAAIPSFQREDGSFALWPGMRGTDEGGLNLFITAYALLVDSEGEDRGFGLPDSVRIKALDYTEKTLQALLRPNEKAERAFPPAPETLALALRVLATHRAERAAALFPDVLALCETRETNPLGWGALLLTLESVKSLPGGKEDAAARILSGLEKTAAVTATQLHFASVHDNGYWRTLGSRLRDNAMVLAALAVARPDYPRLEALAAWVGQGIGDTKILTTQEAVFGLWGLAEYLGSLGGDRETVIRAVWNGKDEVSASFTRLMQAPVRWNVPSDALNGGNASNLILDAVKGGPYWTARLAYASPDLPVTVENAGFTLVRETGTKGPWKVGDTLEVTVTVTVPATRRHVLLFDPFPAGFEPLHTSRVDLMDRERRNEANPSGPWQWQDAVDDGMLLYAPVIHPGTYAYTYTLRAAASGGFTQRPTVVEEMYAPEVFGRTGMGTVSVAP